ncbi:MAG: MFS transporter [bacterium]|nr:MFS transporter [bacterium]
MRGPILISYMTNTCKMSLPEVYTCEAVAVAVLVLFQLPTGILADKFGRILTIKIGCLILILEQICFSSANGPLLIWVGNILWAIGTSFISGADSALIFDSIKSLFTCEDKTSRKNMDIVSRVGFYSLMLTAVFSAICGHLAKINMRIPLYVDLGLITGAFVTAFFFEEPIIHSENKKMGWNKSAIHGIKTVFKQKQLLWVVFFSALVGITSKIWFFSYNPYFELVDLPLEYYGYVFFALNIFGAVSNKYAKDICEKVTGKNIILLSIFALTVPMIILGICISKWAISLIFFQSMFRGFIGPFLNTMLHKVIESYQRATILSIKSAIQQVFESITMLSFGFVVGNMGLSYAIIALGLVSTIIGMRLIYKYRKLFTG